MVNPCPGYKITTPYGKTGSAWGCGMHDGVDFAAPNGADVVAAWGGTVVEAAYPTSFGSAFGRAVVIDHDKLPDGSPGLWGLYAHLSAENVSVGQRVEAGQKIGDVDSTGNSSGHHLHFGVYPSPGWSSCGGEQPQPWIDAQVGSQPQPEPEPEPEPLKPRREQDMILVKEHGSDHIYLAGVQGLALIHGPDDLNQIATALNNPGFTATVSSGTLDEIAKQQGG